MEIFNKYSCIDLCNADTRSKKEKLMIALVYDFLKRNKIIDEYFECFMSIHSRNLPKENGNLLKECIKYGVNEILSSNGRIPFRNFFYDAVISFDYHVLKDKYKDLWSRIDGRWLRIIDCNPNLKV